MSYKSALFISLLILPISFFAQSGQTADTVTRNKKMHITFDTFRAFQGTLQLNFEKPVFRNSSLCVGLMGTWSQSNGIAKLYLGAQSFDMTTAEGKTIDKFENTELTGLGINLKYKSYLGKHPEVMNGLWFGPEVFYRQLGVQGTYFDNRNLQIAKKTLYLGYAGYAIGLQKTLFDVLCFDTYIGGGFFYSKYSGDDFPTKNKQNYQIDYTGVYLNGSIAIGIVR